MSRPFTENDLAEQLSQDIAWRIREISDLKSAIKSSDPKAQTALLRATLAICYAHWEGHIRFSALKYLSHVSLKKMKFSALTAQFLKNEFLPRLNVISSKSAQEKDSLVDLILSSGDRRFSRVNDNMVSTRSNLNFDVLSSICRVCGVDATLFENDANFIDVILLKRRNAIAHGEDTFIGVVELDAFTDGTISLMRLFSNQLQANAYLQTYRAE